MDIKQHIDTIIILSAFAGAVLWMNGKFNQIERDMSVIEKDITVIRTVLIMKNILPQELANTKE